MRIIEAAQNYLLVPYHGTLFKVGVKRSRYNAWTEDFLWAIRPSEGLPFIKGIDKTVGEQDFGHEVMRIDFVNDKFLSVDKSHLLADTQINDHQELAAIDFKSVIYPKDSSSTTKNVGIFALLDEKAAGILLKGFDPEHYNATYGIIRHNGRWTVKRRLDPKGTRGYNFKDSVFTFVPESVAGRQQVPNALDQITSYMPNAIDAFGAPQGKMLIAITDSSIEALSIANRKLQRLGSVRLPLPVVAVMAEWATGQEVILWENQVHDILQARETKGAYASPFD